MNVLRPPDRVFSLRLVVCDLSKIHALSSIDSCAQSHDPVAIVFAKGFGNRPRRRSRVHCSPPDSFGWHSLPCGFFSTVVHLGLELELELESVPPSTLLWEFPLVRAVLVVYLAEWPISDHSSRSILLARKRLISFVSSHTWDGCIAPLGWHGSN